MSRFRGGEGAGPRCRHGQKPGVNLKDLLQELKITALLEKLETRKMHKRDNKTKLCKTREKIWKHENSRTNKEDTTGVTARI